MSRLARYFRRLDSAQRERARRWYHIEAQRLALLAYRRRCSLDLAAAVFAALSPQRTLEQCRIATNYALRFRRPPPGLAIHRRAVARLLAGEPPLDVLRAEKVRAFYQNLADPSNSDAVTVDIWARRAFYGSRRLPRQSPNLGEYRRIQAAYRRFARKHGLRPHEAQAIVWVAIRESAA